MDEKFCSICGVSLLNATPVYGLTAGVISAEHCGFLIDDDSDWDLYCSACMNSVDRLIAEFKMAKAKG